METWYVRDRGRVIGPFTIEQLRAMRDSRQLQGYHELSRDRNNWQIAELVPGLFHAAPVVTAPVSGPGNGPSQPVGGSRGTNRVPEKGSNTKLVVFSAVFVILAIGLGSLGLWFGLTQFRQNNVAATDPGAKMPDGVIAFTEQTTAAERDAAVGGAVALVVVGYTYIEPDGETKELPANTGTAFAVSNDGYLLTNKHVTEFASMLKKSPARTAAEVKNNVRIEPKVWIFFGRDKYEAQVLHESEDFDLSVLKVDYRAPQYFSLCQTDPQKIPRVKNLSAVGFPGADREAVTAKDRIDQSIRQKVESGSVQRKLPDKAFVFSERDGDMIQSAILTSLEAGEREAMYIPHSAQTSGGNSGGPLLTHDGLVVGINTWVKRTTVKDGKGNVIGITEHSATNFALALAQLRKEIDKHVSGAVWRDLKGTK